AALDIKQDQRGLTRPVDLDDATYPNAAGGDGSDIGAYEAQTLPPGPNFVVNVTADDDDGACEALPGGDCTLREAISAANGDGVSSLNSGRGGGILLQRGNLTLLGCKVINNTATSSAGGGVNAFVSTLTVTNCTFSGNTARFAGAIINAGTLILTGSTLDNN